MANKHPLSIDKHTKVSSCFAICTGRQAEFSTRNKGHGHHIELKLVRSGVQANWLKWPFLAINPPQNTGYSKKNLRVIATLYLQLKDTVSLVEIAFAK